MTYKTDAYLIRCLTNLHLGMGGTNYDVIDNMVQRDVTTHLPSIYSSSLKGALREFFTNKWGRDDERLLYIFGPDSERNANANGNIGHFSFFSGDLLSMPVRAKKHAFYNATTPSLLTHVNEMADNFQVNLTFEVPEAGDHPIINGEEDILEDWKAKRGHLPKNQNVGDNIALFNEKDFKRLARKLPIIARNKLVNGQSKNLFYEEVVPRETRFIFFIAKNDKDDYGKAFDKAIETNVIQLGANASIGYGFCDISKIS